MVRLTDRLNELVLDNYLTSDYNGMALSEMPEQLDSTPELVIRAVKQLLSRGSVTAIFGDVHPNPAIKALPDEPKRVLLRKFASSKKRRYAYIYPSSALLQRRVDRSKYQGRPFALRLALGAPQLTYIAFDPAVLEIYRNDPRYLYHAPIVVGSVSIRDDYYRSRKIRKDDKILIKSFGLCFNARTREPGLAAFLYDLARLPPRHQRWWEMMQLSHGRFRIHPAYWRWANGHFPNSISVLHAIPSLIELINQYSAAIGHPPLFRDEFTETPPEYGWLLRPTQREFNDFAQLLDKMLGENINVRFFRGEIETEQLEKRRDGTIVAKRKWKPLLLEEWLSKHYTGRDMPWKEAMQTFREIRELRNAPAHASRPNIYDTRLIAQQRAIVAAAFRALTDLRDIIATHPDTREVRPPRWMELRHPVLPQ